VITLFFLGIELSSSWANNTVFTVPKWEFWWADASIISLIPSHDMSLLIWRALALPVGGVDLSWGRARNFAVTSVELSVIEVALWARLAFSAFGVPEERSLTLNAIVADFIISSGAA
jgi:hypothetical protein